MLKEEFNKTTSENIDKFLLEVKRNGYKDVLIKTDNDRDFYKYIFKLYTDYLNSIDDVSLGRLSLYCNNKEILKIVDLFKYRGNLDYKSKVKAIKSLDALTEPVLLCAYSNAIYINEDALSDMDKKLIRLLEATILIARCARYNYHKNKIMSYTEEGVAKYKRMASNKYILKVQNIKDNDALILDLLDLDTMTLNILSDTMKRGLLYLYEKLPDKVDGKEVSTWLGVTMCIASDLLPRSIKIYNELERYGLKDKYNKLIDESKLLSKNIGAIGISDAIFKERKVLLPKNGVIVITKEDDIIESILVKEMLSNGTNYSVFITKYTDGSEVLNVIPMSVHGLFYYGLFFKEVEVSNDEDPVYCCKTIGYLLDLYGIRETDLSYDVISPVYWKYRNKGYISENDTVNLKGVVIKREFEIGVAPYIRKINGTRSKEADELAKKLGIELKDGYTIVKEHNRVYNKVKK